MSRRLDWTDRYWSNVLTLLSDNGPMPWYAVKWQLQQCSPSISGPVADTIIRHNIGRTVEVVRRGSTRRRGNLCLKRIDYRPHKVGMAGLNDLRG